MHHADSFSFRHISADDSIPRRTVISVNHTARHTSPLPFSRMISAEQDTFTLVSKCRSNLPGNFSGSASQLEKCVQNVNFCRSRSQCGNGPRIIIISDILEEENQQPSVSAAPAETSRLALRTHEAPLLSCCLPPTKAHTGPVGTWLQTLTPFTSQHTF